MLLVVLDLRIGLDLPAWAAGLGIALGTSVLLILAARRRGVERLGPADLVTLARAVLVAGVGALVVQSWSADMPPAALVLLSLAALALDAVDGWLARRTRTASDLGARFDMETDAFLLLVLSAYVAHAVGWWVLAIGLARYVYVVLTWTAPWMRRSLPPRYWRKVVAAVQGVVLVVAATAALPLPVITGWLVVALVLLAESFGRDIVWLWRHRSDDTSVTPMWAPRRARPVLSAAVTVLAFVLLWVALLLPDQAQLLAGAAFLRLPLELVLLAGLALVLPDRLRAPAAVVVGVVLGLLTILRLLDMGFFAALGRPFDPLFDWRYLGAGAGVLGSAVGQQRATLALTVVGALSLLLLIALPAACVRLARKVARHRGWSARGALAVGAAWVVLAVVGINLAPGGPVASAGTAALATERVVDVGEGLRDPSAFADLAASDAFRDVPAAQRLSGLEGKDVIIAFVESYGRVAVEGAPYDQKVLAVLDDGTAALAARGWSTRTAWLTSSTYGGASWLAHATLESGLHVGNQQRYDQLVSGDRLTLSRAFHDAGWRTVAHVPANEKDWPEGRTFYGYDQIYDASNVGYAGPRFSYATMTDQYVLSSLQRLELARADRRPVMAQLDLVSSHTPWAPLPTLVPWDQVGDGSVFDGMPEQGRTPEEVWTDSASIKDAYATSVAYSLQVLVEYVETYGDDDLVLVLLGDHQPSTVVSGLGASLDVPITIITRDPAVLARTDAWGWTDGMRPGAAAPVWPMESFRDRFFGAFGGR